MNLKVFSLFTLISIASAIAQNNQGGTLVTAPIRPFAVQDTFPTAWANEIKGGPFTSTNLTGLSNIPVSRLEIGSLGYAQNTGLFHRLTSISPVIWSPIDGSNFTNLPISATNISGILPLTSGGTGTNSAEGARTNLGLGTTNDVEFRTVKINLSTGADSLIVTNSSSSAVSTFDDIFVDELDAVSAAFGNTVIVSSNGISFNTNTAAAATRTNLGLGATWLTNTDVTNFRTAIGLGTSSSVTFQNVFANSSLNAPNIFATSRLTLPAVAGDSLNNIWISNGLVRYQSGSLITSTRTLLTSEGNLENLESAATARTNLGLGASWLTNSTSPFLTWTSVPSSPTNSGIAGQIAYTNNYVYICISNNTWRRVQIGTW